MKTYTVNHNLLAPVADALLKLDRFSWYADVLVESIQQSARHQNYILMERLADMLAELADEAQNCQAAHLSADVSQILDADTSLTPTST
ncbi:hypothetical protein PT286_00215 [Neisseriaceae bacterium ESL0693]|nr:hypothetical protein [Neisseriaceae bacterium ESL0693]